MDLLSYDIWLAFATLAVLEIILGIDNVIFISILTNKLPEKQRRLGRILGLSLAMGMRILLLLTISWMTKLTTPLFSVLEHTFTGRDLVLLGGGIFLIAKGVREINNSLDIEEEHDEASVPTLGFYAVLAQIAVIDMVFSLDSVITAVGLVDHVEIMIAAIVVAVIVMMVASGALSKFVDENPPIKMLALCFLVLIGFTLTVEGWGYHIPKGYIYSAMAFSFGVQVLNLLVTRNKRKEHAKQLNKFQLSWTFKFFPQSKR